jgi:PAS domain S-box-containing protein
MNSLPADGTNRRVLIIDDNRSIHDDFRKILAPDMTARLALESTEAAIFGGPTNASEQARFDVDSASQGQEGVMMVKRAFEEGHPYAMAFVDIRMPPGWDGVETTLQVWKIDPDIQIVICTAYSDYSWDEVFKRIGNCDKLLILKKPFDTVEALQLAHALTAKWSLHQQASRKMNELERMVGERTRELQQGEERFRQVAESAGEWIWEVDAESVYRYCSSAVEAMLGYTPEELVGKKHFYDLFAPEAREELKAGAIAAFEQRASFRNFVNPNVHKNGKIVVMETSGSPVLDEQGHLLGYRGTDADVTERRRAEKELKSARAFLDRIINAIGDPVFVKDDKRRFVIVNDALCAIVGRPREALLGQDGDDMFPQDQVDVFRKVDDGVLDTGEENLNEEALSDLSTGEVRIIVTRKSRYVAPDGKRFLVGVIRDFTERKQAETKTRVQVTAMEATTEPILIADHVGIINWVNPAFTLLTGYAPADIVGQPASILVPEGQPDATYRDIQNTLSAGKVWKGEQLNRRKDGSVYLEEISITPVFAESGVVTHQVAVKRDITERMRIEAQLRQQQKLASVGTLARGMAHEINNPIMGITNYAQLIKDRAAGNAALAEFADEILVEGKRVATMTHSLLGLAEEQEAKPFTPVALSDILAAVLPAAEETARQRGIDLSCDIPADLPRISCRPRQIGQVVAALLANALEALEGERLDAGRSTLERGEGMFDAGRLAGKEKKIILNAEVGSRNAEGQWEGGAGSGKRGSGAATRIAERGARSSENGTLNDDLESSATPSSEFRVPTSGGSGLTTSAQSAIRITVADNGPGISEKLQAHAFDPFFTTRDRTRHAGLGLWISRSIAQEHGGGMSMESPSTPLRAGEGGQWTRFHVDLPVEGRGTLDV